MNGRWLLTFILAASFSIPVWAFPGDSEKSYDRAGAAAVGCTSIAETTSEAGYFAAQPSAKKKSSKNTSKAKSSKSSAKLKPKLSEKERKVVLHGTRNTRELGGLPAAGGKYVKEGVLYRSGALCYINESDIDILKDKGIVSVIELRTPKEITSEGRDKPGFAGSVKKIYNLPMVCTSGRGGEAYASYIKKQNYSSISQFFKVLAQKDSYPILFHCSAGKDRTGIMAALVLELLRVPRPIIMDDYLASQRSSKGLKVEADWLRVVFKNIDKAGGIEPFLHNCGVSSADMKKVRENLLVSK
ncbi:MAG: tyrosine-protein phosphatase [Candidatus Bruticola sp.]